VEQKKNFSINPRVGREQPFPFQGIKLWDGTPGLGALAGKKEGEGGEADKKSSVIPLKERWIAGLAFGPESGRKSYAPAKAKSVLGVQALPPPESERVIGHQRRTKLPPHKKGSASAILRPKTRKKTTEY